LKFNLKLFKRIVILVLLGSFIGGIVVGTSFLKNFKYIKNPQILNLLTYRFFLPPALLKEIENDYNLKINSETVDSISELEEKLKDTKAKYDLVSLFSFQALQLDEEARLQPINWSLVTRQDRISSDFLNLGGDEIAKKLLPLSWGINGFAYNTKIFSTAPTSWAEVFLKLDSQNKILIYDIPLSVYNLSLEYDQLNQKSKKASLEKNLKSLINHLLSVAKIYRTGNPPPQNFAEYVAFEMMSSEANAQVLGDHFKFIVPSEGALFWTLNLAEPRFAAHPKEIAIFLNAILAEKNALAILQFNHLSTTYKNLEGKNLDGEKIEPNLKAEYIREIPLTSLKFQNNFPESGIFSQLMNEAHK
jgi:spermidine/putrescine-binding protein